MSDEFITISELTEIDSLNTDDLFLLSRSGEEKKIKLKSELDKKLDNTTSPDNAGKVVGVDEDGSLTFVEGGGGGSALVPDITQAEYDELTPEEQNNGQIRHITDAEETPVPFAVVNDNITTSANVWTAQKTNTQIEAIKEYIENYNKLSDYEEVQASEFGNSEATAYEAEYDGFFYCNTDNVTSGSHYFYATIKSLNGTTKPFNHCAGGGVGQTTIIPIEKGDKIWYRDKSLYVSYYFRYYKNR